MATTIPQPLTAIGQPVPVEAAERVRLANCRSAGSVPGPRAPSAACPVTTWPAGSAPSALA